MRTVLPGPTTAFLGGNPTANTGTLEYNPLFADADNGDFAPTERSPARYYAPTTASGTIGAVPFSNAAAYSNAEVDRLFDAASRTVDDRERGAHYRQAQAIIVRDLPYWWLVETDFTAAWNAGFSGFAPWSGQFAETARRSR